jgi:hypothetical protein
VPFVIGLQQLLEEPLRSTHEAAQRLAAHLRRDPPVPSEDPRVEQCRRGVELVGGGDRLPSCPDRVSHGQADVPQGVDDGADEQLQRVTLEPRMKDEQVDVGRGAQLSPAVPADRDERDPTTCLGVERREQALERPVDRGGPRRAPRRARTGPLEREPGGGGSQLRGRAERAVVHRHASSPTISGRVRGERFRWPRRPSHRCGCGRPARPP